MPYKIFNNWLFDGNINTPLPEELLKTTSPINHLYVIGLFQNYLKLNHYLNKNVNNINLWYMPKDELFLFLKDLAMKFNVYQGRTFFRAWPKRSKLKDILSKKFPELKKYEIDLLSINIGKSEDRDAIYASLGLSKEKKKKLRKKAEKKLSLKKYLSENFSWVKV